MKPVTDTEIDKAVTIGDFCRGMAGAVVTGLAFAVWIYFWLGMGVGP